MTEYISVADMEHVADVLDRWVEYYTYEEFFLQLKGKMIWLDAPMRGDDQAERLAELLDSCTHVMSPIAGKLVNGLAEDLRILQGSEAPKEFGWKYDTVTSFGELKGQVVMGVVKDGIAGIVYQGAEKWLGEGEVNEVGEGPDNKLVCVLNNHLYYGGQQLTGEGEQVTSLRKIDNGNTLANPFLFDNRLAYLETAQDGAYLVLHGADSTEKIHIGIKADDCRFSFGKLYTNHLGLTKPLAEDRAAKSHSFQVIADGVWRGGLRIAQHVESYQRRNAYNPIERVRDVGVVGENLAYLLEVFPEESIEGKEKGHSIIREDWPSKHIVVQHTKCHQGYPVEALEFVANWATKHLSRAGLERVGPVLDRVKVKSTEDLRYEGIVSDVEKFVGQYLNKAEEERFWEQLKD
jgi:hypothetical protein